MSEAWATLTDCGFEVPFQRIGTAREVGCDDRGWEIEWGCEPPLAPANELAIRLKP